jgi:hypothetical protein
MNTTTEVSLDGNGLEVDVGVCTLMMGKGCDGSIRYVKTPEEMSGIAAGTKLSVLYESVTGAACPLGAGKRCLHLERGVLAVLCGGKMGIAWFCESTL